MDSMYSIINFYDELKLKYKDYLKPQIASLAMIQSEKYVYLESIEIGIVDCGFKKETIRRVNLDFLTESDEYELYFDPKDKMGNNIKKFINDFTPYSIINTTDIFHKEACEKINKKYITFGIDT